MTDAATPSQHRSVTPLYRAIMVEFERRRLQVKMPMWRLDDEAGTQDGYFAKALWADTKSGRQARWESLQLLCDALYPEGFDIEIKPKFGLVMTEGKQRQTIRFAAAQTDAKLQRDVMRDLARIRNARLPPGKLRQMARKAGIASGRARRRRRRERARMFSENSSGTECSK